MDQDVLWFAPGIVDTMIAHARREGPRECCGLLSGIGRRARRVFELVNEASAPDRFLVTAGLFAPMKEMRRAGDELVAIYHSHPSAPAEPSKRDIEQDFYPGVPKIIISLHAPEPTVRVFLYDVDGAPFREIAWSIER